MPGYHTDSVTDHVRRKKAPFSCGRTHEFWSRIVDNLLFGERSEGDGIIIYDRGRIDLLEGLRI